MKDNQQPKQTTPSNCSRLTYAGIVVDVKFDLKTLKACIESEKIKQAFINEHLK